MTVSRFTAPPLPSTLVMTARAVALDLGDREGQVPRSRHILEAGIAEVAAGDLRAAFQQVADAVAGPSRAWSSAIPAELVHHRRHEDRRVGHAARNDDLRALP